MLPCKTVCPYPSCLCCLRGMGQPSSCKCTYCKSLWIKASANALNVNVFTAADMMLRGDGTFAQQCVCNTANTKWANFFSLVTLCNSVYVMYPLPFRFKDPFILSVLQFHQHVPTWVKLNPLPPASFNVMLGPAELYTDTLKCSRL